jgi:hypothetical protein
VNESWSASYEKHNTLLYISLTNQSTLIILYYTIQFVALGGLVVSVLATGPKIRGFDPDRGRWIFKGDKNPEHYFLRRGSKAVGHVVDLWHVKERYGHE